MPLMHYVSKRIPKQMRLQPLPENVGTERRVSEVVRQRVPGHGERGLQQLILDSPQRLTSVYVLLNADICGDDGKDRSVVSYLSLSVLTAIFQVNLGYPMFIEAKDDGGGEWWLLELYVVQSSSQIIIMNKPTSSFFTGRMPFLSPNQQCQSTEGENITFHGFAYPKHRSVVSYLFAYFCPFTAWTWLGDKRSMWPEAFYRPHIKNMPLQSSVVVQTMHNQKWCWWGGGIGQLYSFRTFGLRPVSWPR